MNEAIIDQIKQLELKLLHSDMKVSPSLLDTLLAKEFEEIGDNGAVNTRQDVADWLLNKNPQERWLLTDFRVKELSAGLVLAIYHAKKVAGQKKFVSKGSVRSSIWKYNTQGWQIVFHQASKIV
jgi:hypothetical protein